MKKTLLSLCLFASALMAQPIATKNLGTDTASGLQKEIRAWQLTIDTKSEVVIVVYDVVLLAPNGKQVSVLETSSYTRRNIPARDSIPADNRFTALRASQLGAAISQMITETINKYPNLGQ